MLQRVKKAQRPKCIKVQAINMKKQNYLIHHPAERRYKIVI